jgi:hypothetical protein
MINILKMNAKILREIKSRVSAQVTVKMWIAYLLLLIPRIRRGICTGRGALGISAGELSESFQNARERPA